MNTRTLSTTITVAALAAALAAPASAELKLPRPSPAATVQQTIGLTDLSVRYSRPGVKGRKIWGDLVPYDKPWRTGANEATSFTTTGEIEFAGKKLPAGTYSLFTIPTAGEWTVILNSEKDLWGAYEYKPDKDVLTVKLAPTAAAPQEWMQFAFEDLTPNSANLVLRWEKLALAIPIRMEVNGQVLADARAAIAAAEKTDWRTPYQAANFTLTNEVAMDEGSGWLAKSLAVEQNYTNLSLQARWQMKEGKKKEAIATAKKAIAAGKASKDKVDTAQTEKLLADWSGN